MVDFNQFLDLKRLSGVIKNIETKPDLFPWKTKLNKSFTLSQNADSNRLVLLTLMNYRFTFDSFERMLNSIYRVVNAIKRYQKKYGPLISYIKQYKLKKSISTSDNKKIVFVIQFCTLACQYTYSCSYKQCHRLMVFIRACVLMDLH